MPINCLNKQFFVAQIAPSIFFIIPSKGFYKIKKDTWFPFCIRINANRDLIFLVGSHKVLVFQYTCIHSPVGRICISFNISTFNISNFVTLYTCKESITNTKYKHFLIFFLGGGGCDAYALVWNIGALFPGAFIKYLATVADGWTTWIHMWSKKQVLYIYIFKPKAFFLTLYYFIPLQR